MDEKEYQRLMKEARRLELYVLDGKELRRIDDAIEWAREFALCDRRVASTILDKTLVSTVFIGVPSPPGSLFGDTPLAFETAVFREGKPTDIVDRYATWDEAEEGHKNVVESLRKGDRRSG